MPDVLNYLLSPSLSLFDKIFILLSIIVIPISIFTFGFVIFLLIYAIKDLLTPKTIPKCQVCQKLEPDMLSREKEYWFLCRKHLLEKYSDLFLKNTFKVVAEFTPGVKSKKIALLTMLLAITKNILGSHNH